MIQPLFTVIVASPVGPLLAGSDGQALQLLQFGAAGPAAASASSLALFDELRRQLDAYFAGTLRRFTLPLAPEGTPFQRAVWQALLDIPYGATASYRDVAQRIGAPGAVRAVGAANGRNPLPILVPCHRVIGSDGTLTGYAGGLGRKRALLDLERDASGAQAQQTTLFA